MGRLGLGWQWDLGQSYLGELGFGLGWRWDLGQPYLARVGICVRASVGADGELAATGNVAAATVGFVDGIAGTVHPTRTCAKATQKQICLILFIDHDPFWSDLCSHSGRLQITLKPPQRRR